MYLISITSPKNWKEDMHNIFIIVSVVKLGLSERKKIWKIFLMVLTNQLIWMSKPRGRFFQIMCASQKVRTLFIKLGIAYNEKKNLQHASIEVITLLWEGHKIGKNLPLVLSNQLFLLSSVRQEGYFFKFLWPSQKSWTLIIIMLWYRLQDPVKKLC
jgi:hypothetical protein